MDRRAFLSTVAVGACASPLRAQAPARVPRIGVLSIRLLGRDNPLNAPLMEGLRDHGYVDGRNIEILFTDTQGREERLPELALDLVRRRVDVIVVIGPAPLEPARRATRTIPIVMVASSADPVGEGIAASLSRPGGNVTGLTYAEPDRFKKQLEFLKSAAGRVTRLTVLWDFDLGVYKRDWEAPLAAAGLALGIAILEPVRIRLADELPAAFATIRERRADALLVASGGALLPARERVAALAIEHRLPAIAAFKEFPQAGLLMSYGPDLPDINRRAGGYVDRILKGAKPGDLPIELPSKFDLVVNQKTARALGIVVPQPVLMRATDVIPA